MKSIFLSLMILSGSCYSQELKSFLEPENANEERLNRLQPPEQVMDAIGIRPGMTVAEIGAGQGRYVMQLVGRVGETGKVYAEDIDKDALDHLKNRCNKWSIANVEIIPGEVADPKLPAGKLDVIFIISSYHHFSDPVELLKNARPALKPGGILAVGEWLTSTSPARLEQQVTTAGYKLLRTEKFLEQNNLYIYIFGLQQ